MSIPLRRTCAVLVALFTVAVLASPPAHAAPKQQPVPSLQPRATAKLWRQLVRSRSQRPNRLQACTTPLRLVFYTQTDWLRLATKLAANASPCAQYYISIPPLAADKTRFRTDQAWRIRALGPQFHALAEFNYTGWSSWVTANGASWNTAGVEARRRIAASGFDFASGDGWVMNEASSAVRAGTGVARTNLRLLLQGLYAGDGTVPAVKGAVFITGISQATSPLTTYKANLESWFLDSPFWNDMTAYVSDWSQELYGDVRKYAVPGAPPDVRRDELNAFLQHPLTLASAGQTPATAFLQSTYSPLANAAWQYESGYGWTAVPFDQMADFVSAQVYALSSAGSHWGFAWALQPPAGMSSSEFASQSGAIADRLAKAIHDASVLSPDAACAGTCTLALAGTVFNEGWKDFVNWSPPTLVFTNAPLAAVAGTAAPLALQIQIAGIVKEEPVPVQVTLRSTSPQGSFASAAEGPWAPTLTVTILPGATSATFFYRDTAAGNPTIVASAPGHTDATQTETISAAPIAALAISPATARLRIGAKQTFTATAVDVNGQSVPVTPTWTATGGNVTSSGVSAVFTATRAGPGSVVATVGTLTASATVTVLAPVRVTKIRFSLVRGRLRVAFVLRPGVRGRISFAIPRVAAGTVSTSARGVAVFTSRRPIGRGCYRTKIKAVRALGFAWDGVTPPNRYCR